MKVNFNNLRRMTMASYNNICRTLNDSLKEHSGIIKIDAEDIQQDMDDLRGYLAGIACCYDPDDNMFSDLADDADKMEDFNAQEEKTQKEE